jgi:hypothetical protein
MGWEEGYDVLGSAGGTMPLAFLNWNSPTISDVMAASGAGQYAPGLGRSTTGGQGYLGLGTMPAPGTPYPALGFDPAPGDPGEISHLVATLGTAAHKLGAAHDLIQKMADDKDSWQGDAAEAFHQKLKDKLPKYLQEGSESLQKAADDLRGWSTRLDGYRSKAQGHESDACSARSGFATAWTDAVAAVGNNRDALALQGQHFDTDAALKAANDRLRAAMSTIEDAVTRCDRAFGALHQIVSDAKHLADTHSADASTVAAQLRHAAHDIAPHKPNPFLNWIKEHGGDILSAAAAICGVLALFCPVFAIPAILLSAGALGLHAWKMASDGAKLWPPSMEAAGNWATLGCDALGAIPGIGVTAKAAGLMKDAAEAGEAANAANTAVKATEGAEAAAGATEKATAAAGDAAEASGDAAKAPGFASRWGEAAKATGGDGGVNPLVDKGLRRAIDGSTATVSSDTTKFAGKLVQFNVNATGATFATAGLFPDAAANQQYANSNTVVTGGADALAAAPTTAGGARGTSALVGGLAKLMRR